MNVVATAQLTLQILALAKNMCTTLNDAESSAHPMTIIK